MCLLGMFKGKWISCLLSGFVPVRDIRLQSKQVKRVLQTLTKIQIGILGSDRYHFGDGAAAQAQAQVHRQ